MSRPLRSLSRTLAGLAPLLVLLVAWQVLGDESSAFFPPPSKWWDSLNAIGLSEIWSDVMVTLRRFAVGLLFAFVVGFALGILIGRIPTLDAIVSPTLEFFRATPAPALVPLIILLAGAGERTLIIAVSLAALWPILLNSVESARRVEPLQLDSARTLQLSTLDRVRQVTIPAVVPGVFVGVRVALPIALVVTLLAEMLTGAGGLGGRLLTAQRTYATASAFGLLVIAGLLGVLLSLAFQRLESYIGRNWRAS